MYSPRVAPFTCRTKLFVFSLLTSAASFAGDFLLRITRSFLRREDGDRIVDHAAPLPLPPSRTLIRP